MSCGGLRAAAEIEGIREKGRGRRKVDNMVWYRTSNA